MTEQTTSDQTNSDQTTSDLTPGGGSGLDGRGSPGVDLVLVDDHDAVRFGIRRALSHPEAAGMRVVGEARDAAALRSLVVSTPCDVVILDLALGDGSDPAESIAWLADQSIKVMVYSVGDDPYLVRRALAAGVHGLSRKSEPILTTIRTLREVADGQLMISDDILAAIDGDADFVEARLSAREAEVLVMYVSGFDLTRISQQLFLTENSAKEYLRRIRVKYNLLDRPAGTKVDLLRRAVEDGLIEPVVRR